MKHLFLLWLTLLTVGNSPAQRIDSVLKDDWRFLKRDAAPDAPVTPGWEKVSLPHCYNAMDGQNGRALDGGYYRGPTWYQRTLQIPESWRGGRVFIRFAGVFLVADVYLNGEKIGQHRGGFAAFCYELTDKFKMDAPNDLRVRVDNSRQDDVAPLSADFTMEGGIYRPVELLITPKACITPLDYGGPGVYAAATHVSAESADVDVEVKLDSTDPADDVEWTLKTSISSPMADEAGRAIPPHKIEVSPDHYQTVETSMDAAPAQTVELAVASGLIRQRFHVDHPHLWNGPENPFLYTVRAELLRHKKGSNRYADAPDEVTVPLGFRTVAVDNERGFLLNGKPYAIHGVNRHQEKQDQGWALSDVDHDEDFRLIREMGATAVRLAHYQQAQHVQDIADKTGLLLWQEIPVVNEISDNPAFAENAKQQLTEMIRQCSNHPSIMTWSVCNELYNNQTPPVEPLIRSLVTLAAELDPTRTPAGVSDHPDKKELNQIPPWIGFNQYPGWYGNNVENFARDVKSAWESAGGDKRIAITEYGAGANPTQHQEGPLTQPKPGGPWHPEEWQSYLHARSWDQVRDDPHVWGTFIWAMFDFAVDSRNEGETPGLNDKGMVTHDRQTKKDTFFFYKANWNPEPMVYLTSRRAVKRTASQTQIKAYTNLPEAELTLNGRSLGTKKPSDSHVLIWPDVTLQPGHNVVAITARGADGKTVSDRCEWTLSEPAAIETGDPHPATTP